MAYPTIGTTSAITTVDCQKQVRSWRLLRSLVELLIPTCNCTIVEEGQEQHIKPEKCLQNCNYPPLIMTSTTNITGTIFGYRKGKVSFCLQANTNSINPILLLELAVPTTTLAKEMQAGMLRIVLESAGTSGFGSNSGTLLSSPLWTMYYNGRKVGYAGKRRPSNTDLEVLSLMHSVVVGADIINTGKDKLNREDELMYLRANFERVRGSSDSESFHLIDPDGGIGQELSIFFFRTR